MKTEIEKVLASYPKIRNELPAEYAEIYDKHYKENRNGTTKVTSISNKLERWLHKKVANTSFEGCRTLEIGAGTLNQFKFEKKRGVYDIVEPYRALYADSPYVENVNSFYNDISEISIDKKYDRIISVASFEHVLNLPEVIEKAIELLDENGVLAISIPNEGRFLWKFAYENTTGREFKKRYGLNYDVIMHYEHVNQADEIETLLRYYFSNVKEELFGVSKDLAFYRFYLCTNPRKN